MAIGTIKRHDTEPSPRLTINAASGGAYNLGNHSVKMIMVYRSTLSDPMDDMQTTITLPRIAADAIEVDDIILVDHERMEVQAPLPVQPIAGSTAEFNISRGFDYAATAGVVISSKNVAGTGANQYVLSADANFDLGVDSGTPGTVTVTAASTVGNTTMANLVTDVQDAVTGLGAAVTVGSANDKLTFTSNSAGASSNLSISNVDAIAGDELGLVAAYGIGEDAHATVAAGHATEVRVNVLKIERSAIVEDPSSAGRVTFEWVEGDTDKLGVFDIEFELTTPQGKKFTAPNNNSFDVEIVPDYDNM